jgi:hypothetical protein
LLIESRASCVLRPIASRCAAVVHKRVATNEPVTRSMWHCTSSLFAAVVGAGAWTGLADGRAAQALRVLAAHKCAASTTQIEVDRFLFACATILIEPAPRTWP